MTDRQPTPRTDPEPTPQTTSRLTTDGTKYLPETYESTDGTRELPHPMIDPMSGRRGRLPDHFPIGDPRLEPPAVAPPATRPAATPILTTANAPTR